MNKMNKMKNMSSFYLLMGLQVKMVKSVQDESDSIYQKELKSCLLKDMPRSLTESCPT